MSSVLPEQDKKLYTAEDLERLSAEGFHYELIRGELFEMTPPGGTHGSATERLSARATVYNLDHDLGEGFAAGTGFWIARNPDTVLAPDWAFIAKERLPDPLPDSYVEVVPDIVLETRSPNDTRREVEAKVARWLQAGVRLVWELDPKARVLTVHRSDREAQKLGIGDTLSGEDVLPGFSLPVRRLFRDADA
jgi:Uma2 family endonuclease